MRKEIMIFLIISGVLFAAGCAENGIQEGPVPSTPSDEETEVIDVEIRDFQYIPQSLTVEIGQTVRWTNYDNVPHDVVGSGIESEHLQQGETFSYTFEQVGIYEYICTIHPWMEGEVIVEN